MCRPGDLGSFVLWCPRERIVDSSYYYELSALTVLNKDSIPLQMNSYKYYACECSKLEDFGVVS